MLKPILLALVGVAIVAPAASADSPLPTLPRPDLGAVPAPLNSPAVDLCDRFGIACTQPGLALDVEPDLNAPDLADLIPLAQADAAKRWALYAEEWAEIAELYEEYEPADVPTTRLPQIAQGYGWQHGQIADITELLDDVQERLDRRPVPLHSLPFVHIAPRHSFGNLPHRFYGYAAPRSFPRSIVRPNRLPGNSVIILPGR